MPTVTCNSCNQPMRISSRLDRTHVTCPNCNARTFAVLPWPRSVLLWTIAAIAAAVAVCVLVVIVAIISIPKRAQQIAEPVDQQPQQAEQQPRPQKTEWVDAPTKDARIDDVTVHLESAIVGGAPLIGFDGKPYHTAKKYLVLSLTVKNHSETKKLIHRGWAPEFGSWHAAELDDNFDNIHRRVTFGIDRLVDDFKGATINPEKTVKGVLVFDVPIERMEYLRLKLPASAWGGKASIDCRFRGRSSSNSQLYALGRCIMGVRELNVNGANYLEDSKVFEEFAKAVVGLKNTSLERIQKTAGRVEFHFAGQHYLLQHTFLSGSPTDTFRSTVNLYVFDVENKPQLLRKMQFHRDGKVKFGDTTSSWGLPAQSEDILAYLILGE